MDFIYDNFDDWLCHHLSHNELADLCHHNKANKVIKLNCYAKTTALYDQYHEDIWNILLEDSDHCGDSCLTLLAACRDGKSVCCDARFKHLLVHYAAGKIAVLLTQGIYLKAKA